MALFSRSTGAAERAGLSGVCVGLVLLLTACGPPFVLPSLDHQKRNIANNEIRLRALSSKAFLETWGKPTYRYRARVQFFPLENGNYLPRFRVPLGESPQGWDLTTVLEDALFLAYADRGELLGFIDQRLVYRERLSAEQVLAVVKQWKDEEQFRTGLEKALPVPQ